MKIIQGKWLAAAATTFLVALTPAFVPDAAAGHDDFRFGASFRIGNVHLSIGHQPYGYGHGYGYGSASSYYYRTNHAVHYDGYQCTDRCYRRGRSYYHYESCPVVLHLLHLNRIHPHDVFARHAPHYDGRFSSYDPYAFHRSYSGRHGRHGRYRDYDDGYRDHGHWRDRRGHRRHDRGRHRGWYRRY